MRRFHPSVIIIGVLLVIGMITTFVQNPSILIIGVAVFGGIYLLYKFPPDRWFGRKASNGKRPKIKPSARTAQKMQAARSKTPRKSIPFRVIEGGKDDDDVPKYH